MKSSNRCYRRQHATSTRHVYTRRPILDSLIQQTAAAAAAATEDEDDDDDDVYYYSQCRSDMLNTSDVFSIAVVWRLFWSQ